MIPQTGKSTKALPDRAPVQVSGCWSACVVSWWSLYAPQFLPCLLFMAWKKDRSNLSWLLWIIIDTTTIVDNVKRVDKFCGLEQVLSLFLCTVLGCSIAITAKKKIVCKETSRVECPVRFTFWCEFPVFTLLLRHQIFIPILSHISTFLGKILLTFTFLMITLLRVSNSFLCQC